MINLYYMIIICLLGKLYEPKRGEQGCGLPEGWYTGTFGIGVSSMLISTGDIHIKVLTKCLAIPIG